MIVTTTTSVVNAVQAVSLGVEVDTLEFAYINAYGEPQIDLAGLITYVPDGTAPEPTPIPFDFDDDVGTVPVGGGSTWVESLGAWELTGSGIVPVGANNWPGYLKGTREVTGDFQIECQLLAISGVATGAPPPGFRVGLVMWDGNASDDPGYLFGWGSPGDAICNLSLLERELSGGASTVINSVVMSTGRGLSLRLRREDDTLTAWYSDDNQETWIEFASVTLTTTTFKMGLFVDSGLSTLATAAFGKVQFVVPAPAVTDTYTIAGGPRLVYIRSQAPHEFQIDGNMDPEARTKVAGWGTTIKDRLEVAKNALMARPNPLENDHTSVEQL